MWKNYLKVALRTLRRNLSYTAINVGGLAVGMAACLLIALFVRDELSYDDFHENADRIYQAAAWTEQGGRKVMFGLEYGAGERLLKRSPEVKDVVRMSFQETSTIKTDSAHFEDEAYYASHNFFDVFTFPLERGNPQMALKEPQSVVLTPQAARKYFGNQDPMGQTLTIDEGEEKLYTVTGVTRPLPSNTSFQFDLLLSASTINPGVRDAGIYQTFVLLDDPEGIEKLRQIAPEQILGHFSEDRHLSYVALPDLYLSDLTTQSGFKGSPRYLYLFSVIAVFILLLAGANYMNLATARSERRALEVGVRKTVGASRGQLARQFLGESVLMSTAALLLALLLTWLTLPAFNGLFEKELTLVSAEAGPFALGLLALTLVVGLGAGSYPALYLSRFQPTGVLAGTSRGSTASGSGWMRKGLVTGQFAVTLVLLIGTAVVWQQLHFMRTKDLGFNKDNVVVLRMGPDALKNRHETVKRALLEHPNVVGAAAASAMPGEYRVTTGVRLTVNAQEKHVDVKPVNVDSDYLEVMGHRLVKGRGFSEERTSDKQGAYVLNEAAVRAIGWQESIGKEFGMMDTRSVIGVVEDFHFASPRQKIEPVVFRVKAPESSHKRFGSYYTVAVRIKPDQTQQTLAFLEKQWNRFVAERPFEYTFLDQRFEEMYRSEERLRHATSVSGGLALFIACLGLFGLAAYMAERRTKEIGIRKALGASVGNIVALLSSDFAKLVAIAVCIASPVAYYAMSRWLDEFAHRIELGPWVFVGAGLLTLAIAMATVSYHALRAALANPVEAIRYE